MAGKTANASVASVKRALKVIAQKKYFDTTVQYQDQTVASTLGTQWIRLGTSSAVFAPLNAPIVGTGVNNRIANKIRMTHMMFNATCTMANYIGGTGGASTPYTTTAFMGYFYPAGVQIRFAVVLDRESDGLAPVGTEIFNVAGYGSSGPFFNYPRNHDYVERYQVLKYIDVVMTPGAMCPCNWKFYVKLPKLVQFKNVGGADTDMWKNAVTLWAVSSCVRASDNYPLSTQGTGGVAPIGAVHTFTVNVRTEYTDD